MKTTAEKSSTVSKNHLAIVPGREVAAFIPARSVQAKLTVNKPGDAQEKEADQMAQQVMQPAAPVMQKQEDEVQRMPSEEEEQVQRMATEEEEQVQRMASGEEEEQVQRKCTDCEKEEESPAEKIQRSPTSANAGGSVAAPPIVSEVTATSGERMDSGTQGYMEQRFGADFSGVRVHTDSKAQQSADAISAHAYTYKNHIAFAKGKYEPHSQSGKTLLAHELTHVVQQTGQVQRQEAGGAGAAPPPIASPATQAPSNGASTGTPPPPQAAAEDTATAPPAAEPLPQEPVVIEPIMPAPPEELGPAAQQRLRQSQSAARTSAEQTATVPDADADTQEARAGVTEPDQEADARASGALAAALGARPEPSPEILELCDRIREVIRSKRPPDEDSLLSADPEEAANEAGTQLNQNVEGDVDRVEGEYNELDESPTGTPEQIGQPLEETPESVDTPDMRAEGAAPDPLSPEEVSLDADVEASAQQMEEAGMTTPAAQAVQDGPIAEARAAHGELEQTAAEDPALVLAEQDTALANARGDMETLQAQALEALQRSRSGNVSGSATQQTNMVQDEVSQRESIAQQADDLFAAAQTDVNNLLEPLTSTAMDMWERGKERIATEFEQHLARVQSWVDDRHSGFGGGVVELWDDLTGLPDWVTDEYDDAERSFGDSVCELITEISAYVNGVILTCETIIDNANLAIDTLFANAGPGLEEWAATQRAAFQERLDGLRNQVATTQQDFNRDLAQRASEAVQEVRERVHALREAAKGLLGRIADALLEFLEDPLRAIINGLLRLVGIEPSAFWALIARIEQVIADIVADPLGFASNLLSAIGAGFQQFFDNFFSHLFEGFIQWVFSGLGAVGVEIPQDLSLGSIITFFLQLMGITWDRVRMLLARHIGEENVALLEQAYQIISDLITLGPEGIFELIKDQLNPQEILNQVIEMAVNYVIETLVAQATIRIIGLFNPVGAIAQAIEAIYRVISWIFENAARIFTLVETVVNGISDIVAGNIAGMANTVERALTQLLVPVIDFVASFMGLGNLPERVADMIRGLQNWVEGILDRVIGWLAARARGVLEALGIGGEEGADGAQILEDREVGDRVTFQAGGEQHHIWVNASAGQVEVMVASDNPMSVAARLTQWEGRINTLPQEEQAQARTLISRVREQYNLTKREGEQSQDAMEEAQQQATPEKIAQAQQEDNQVEQAERAMTPELGQLFDLFGEEHNIDWKEVTTTTFTEESGDTHKVYLEQESDGDKELYMESVKMKIETYLQNKKQEANQANNNAAKTLVADAEHLLGSIKTITGQESTPNITTIISDITALSRKILELENLDETDFPDRPTYRNIAGGKKAIHLYKDNITPTGDPSGVTPEYSFLQTAGHTANSSPDKWVRMHLIYDKLGGPPDSSNWVPAPNSVNTGTFVRGFETSVLQLVNTTDATGTPNLIWAESKVTQYHPAHTRYLSLGGFAKEVSFQAGLHLPPQGNETEWRTDLTPRVSQTANVPPPPRSNVPSLSTATGTSLRALDQVQTLVDANTLFSVTTMDRIKQARANGNFTSVRNFELRLIAIDPDNTRWVNKVSGDIVTGVRALYRDGYITIG